MAAMAVTESFKLPEHFNLEPEVREQLSAWAGHQRCIEGAGELLLVVHEVPRPGDPQRDTLFFWKCREGTWMQAAGPSLGSGTGLSGLVALLDRYEETLNTHHESLAKATTAAEIRTVLRHAHPLARASRNLLQALEHALAIDPDDRTIRNCRDHAREIDRTADLLATDARVTLDSRQAECLELLDRTTSGLKRNVSHLTYLAGILLLLLAALAACIGKDLAVPVVLLGVVGAIVAFLLARRSYGN